MLYVLIRKIYLFSEIKHFLAQLTDFTMLKSEIRVTKAALLFTLDVSSGGYLQDRGNSVSKPPQLRVHKSNCFYINRSRQRDGSSKPLRAGDINVTTTTKTAIFNTIQKS